MLLRRLFFVLTGLWSSCLLATDPTAPGLYAVFETTQGNFTARLDYDKAPITVANFVSLAEGSRTWVNPTNGVVGRTPFFDGLTFHRVIPGFVIQGGSPNGLGTDGPGYAFPDEFHPDLRHSRAGILSMANSGQNSNGSQFFITLAATAWLNDVHSVFGEVIDGTEVPGVIAAVPRDSGDKPLTPQLTQRVRIVRVGDAAQAFAVSRPELPTVEGLRQLRLRRSGNQWLLDVPQDLNTIVNVRRSTNLLAWEAHTALGVFAPPTSLELDATTAIGTNTRFFFRGYRIVYPTVAAPTSLAGQRWNIEVNTSLLSGGRIKFTVIFANSGNGVTYRQSGFPDVTGTHTYVRNGNRITLTLNNFFSSGTTSIPCEISHGYLNEGRWGWGIGRFVGFSDVGSLNANWKQQLP